MIVSLSLSILLLAPAVADCDEDKAIDAFANKQWATVEAYAKKCGAANRQFHYFAAQAHEKRGKWADQCRSTAAYLKNPGGDNRPEVQRMDDECTSKLQKEKEAKERAAAKAAADKAAADKAAADKAAADQAAADQAAADKAAADQAANPQNGTQSPGTPPQTAPNNDRRDDLHDDPPIDPKSTQTTDRTRQRLWLGIGIGAGVTALVGITTGLYGHFAVTRPARDKNAAALTDAGVPDDFNPSCIPDCPVADEVERQYASADYYQRLHTGLTRESVGAGLGTATLGLILGALPEVARTPRARHIGLGAMIVGGAAALAGGAAMLAHFTGKVNDSLGGYDATTNPDGWRAGGFDGPRSGYIASAALAGFGAGLIVGASTTAAVRWRDGSDTRKRRASVRFTPTFTGFALTGRF